MEEEGRGGGRWRRRWDNNGKLGRMRREGSRTTMRRSGGEGGRKSTMTMRRRE